jgi:hypothetical protein
MNLFGAKAVMREGSVTPRPGLPEAVNLINSVNDRMVSKPANKHRPGSHGTTQAG